MYERTVPASTTPPRHAQRPPALAWAWTALGGNPRLMDLVTYTGPADTLPSGFPVRELAMATVACCSLAAAELAAARYGAPVPQVRVDSGAVATAFTSERHLLIDGAASAGFAPLSRFWRTADGWIRTHANYPHHRARLLDGLGVGSGRGEAGDLVAQVAGRLRESSAWQVQEAVFAAGGVAVAVREAGEWERSEAGRAAAAAGLVDIQDPASGTAPGPASGPAQRLRAAALPAAGVRVLDLTRVIAGPVATRMLAFLGADVLRVDTPRLPEAAEAHADTGFGKRSVSLDLARRVDRATFEDLLSGADVIVTGYRPGALDRYGLSGQALLARRPGLVVAQLSAWGHDGPWAPRRGFDSLVQAACGIAAHEAAADGTPGALPAQALDHGTGYLLAASVLRALTERQQSGHGRLIRTSLAATATWLRKHIPADSPAGSPTGAPDVPYDPASWLAETDSPLGRLRHAVPPVVFEGGPRSWSRPPGPPGLDHPQWL